MSVSHSEQLTVEILYEMVQDLASQVSSISRHLQELEEKRGTISSSDEEVLIVEGDAAFLGRKYQKSTFHLEEDGGERCGIFLGKRYCYPTAKVETKTDGTTRTFLGRKFSGRTLDT